MLQNKLHVFYCQFFRTFKYSLRRFLVLNDLSHSTEVTGNEQRMRRRTFMLGKKLGSHSLRVAEACTGWKTRFVSYFWPFATPTNQLNDNDWQSVTKIIPIKLNFCINCGVTWAHQYFRYQTHQFGDIHLAFTEVGVNLGYQVVHQGNAQRTLEVLNRSGSWNVITMLLSFGNSWYCRFNIDFFP